MKCSWIYSFIDQLQFLLFWPLYQYSILLNNVTFEESTLESTLEGIYFAFHTFFAANKFINFNLIKCLNYLQISHRAAMNAVLWELKRAMSTKSALFFNVGLLLISNRWLRFFLKWSLFTWYVHAQVFQHYFKLCV